MSFKILACFLLIIILQQSVFAQIQLIQSGSAWSLEVNGNYFDVKGVTFGYNDPSEFGYHFRQLKSMGVNSIRTWGTDENTRACRRYQGDGRYLDASWKARHGSRRQF